MTERTRVDWDGARREYEAATSSKGSLARKYGTTVGELDAKAKANRWSDARRSASTDRIILIDRLLGVLELQVEHMETTKMTPSGEREAAVLGRLTATLGKLIALANGEARGTASEFETAEMRDIRQKLAKRINALTKS
jgi:hypothetical protein